MKNLFLTSISLILLTGLFFTSCQKGDLASESIKDKSEADIISAKPPGYGVHRYYYDNGNPTGTSPKDFGCKEPAKDCLDDITVKGIPADLTEDLFDQSGSSTSEMREFVRLNLEALSEIIDGEYLEGVVEQKFTLRTRGNFSAGKKGFIIISKGDDIVSVQPVQKL